MNTSFPTQMQMIPRYKIPTKKTSYTPVADGFISSAGNKELSMKYGNDMNIPGVSTADIYHGIQRTMIESVFKK